jgi:acyl carrier protein
MSDTTGTLRAFITENFYVTEPDELGDGDSLLQQGIVDSTGVLEVVAFLERTFGIGVDDAEILPANLDSIAAMAAFVERKRGAGGGPGARGISG